MSRPLRVTYTGTFYHITAHGDDIYRPYHKFMGRV